MVNENTRMYVPEENHQGKRDPSASPGSPALPTAGPGGAARAACARGANVARGSPREPAEPPCEPERKIPAPPPPRPGFFGACGSHEIPSEGESSPSVSAAWISRLCLESPAGQSGGLGEPGSGCFGVPCFAGARQGTRALARTPRRPAPRRWPPRLPRVHSSRRHFLGQCAPGRGWGWGRGLQLCVSARLLSPSSPAPSTPPTSPLPLTLREPTPGVLLFAPGCGLAPEDGKRLEAPVMCVGFAFPCCQGIMKGCD